MPTNKKDPKDPSETSLEYDLMLPQWQKFDTLLGGTDAMRAAGTTYLPQHTEEDQGAYDERLHRSTLFNMTEITLNEMVGKPFSEPVQVNEDVPETISLWLEDIDLQGNNIDVFARNWFREGLAKAYSHVLVDFPRLQPKPNGGKRTLADDRQENVRPYWVHIPPENLIFARAEVIRGTEVLQEVRILETIIEQDGFIQTVRQQVRRILPGIVEFWKPTKQKRNGKPIWVMDEQFSYDLPFIPLVTFYSNRQGFMLGRPPLTDLADLNIQHWQSMSDQINVLTVARFPILALSGASPESGAIKIGPRKWLHSPDAQSKYYYVEHEGNAIEAGEKDLERMEERMGKYGSEFLRKRPGNTTATARALDSSETTSPLQDMVIRFMDAVNLALSVTAQWVKLDKEGGGSISIPTDFGPDLISDSALSTLGQARRDRDISREAYLSELKLHGVLSEDFDPEKDKKLLEKEIMDNADGDADLDLDEEGNRIPEPEEDDDDQDE